MYSHCKCAKHENSLKLPESVSGCIGGGLDWIFGRSFPTLMILWIRFKHMQYVHLKWRYCFEKGGWTRQSPFSPQQYSDCVKCLNRKTFIHSHVKHLCPKLQRKLFYETRRNIHLLEYCTLQEFGISPRCLSISVPPWVTCLWSLQLYRGQFWALPGNQVVSEDSVIVSVKINNFQRQHQESK